MTSASVNRADKQAHRRVQQTLQDGPLAAGADERAVKDVEKMLKLAGWNAGVVDNKFTERTAEAIRGFQGAVGLPQTGELDTATFNKLKGVQGRIRRHDGDVVGVGQAGDRVEKAEKRLRKLGYDTGPADGVYDARTAAAVKAFKKDQGFKNEDGSALGEGGSKVLKKESRALEHAPERRRVKPTKERKRLDEATRKSAAKTSDDGSLGIGPEDRGRVVKNVQGHLKAAGFDPKGVDGKWDDRTEGALKQFQRKSGLPASGRVDPATWNKLQKATLEASGPASPAQREGERSSAVKRTEKALKSLGYDVGKVDGFFDAKLEKAAKKFEKKHHREVDGAVSTGDLKAIKKAQEADVGPTRLVNGYNSGRPFKLRVATVEGKLVEEHVARAYKKMEAAARKDGVELNIVSGFRTMEQQQYLYNLWLSGNGNLAARPGYSNHQNGRALDLNVQTGSSDAVGVGRVYNWLANNAHRFGFKRIAAEAWHWEYQGKVGV